MGNHTRVTSGVEPYLLRLTPGEIRELVTSTGRDIERLKAMTNRRARRAAPGLAAEVTSLAADMETLLTEFERTIPAKWTLATFSTKPLTAIMKMLGPVLAAAAPLTQALASLAARVAALILVVAAASVDPVAYPTDELPAGCGHVPRPPVGPRVPHGPPAGRRGSPLPAAA